VRSLGFKFYPNSFFVPFRIWLMSTGCISSSAEFDAGLNFAELMYAGLHAVFLPHKTTNRKANSTGSFVASKSAAAVDL
jgi:hypothetical protein